MRRSVPAAVPAVVVALEESLTEAARLGPTVPTEGRLLAFASALGMLVLLKVLDLKSADSGVASVGDFIPPVAVAPGMNFVARASSRNFLARAAYRGQREGWVRVLYNSTGHSAR